MKVLGEGPIPSRIMLVGEAPGAEEERLGHPFVGASGMELNRLLGEVGILRSECYVTNICKTRPPNNELDNFIARTKSAVGPQHTQLFDKWVTKEVTAGYAELLTEIRMVQPHLIIAFGNLALWALRQEWGVTKWRGSMMEFLFEGRTIKLIPTLHPAAVLREWSWRRLVLADLRRAKAELSTPVYVRPKWQFLVRPTYHEVTFRLGLLYAAAACPGDSIWIDFDIETRGRGHVHIDCIGISWSKTEAMCIPFMCRTSKDGYWNLEEETQIVFMLYKLLTHSNVRVRWQNGLYDAQIVHHNWHFIPRGGQDTMIAQHSLFCALPKALHTIASLYAEWYYYWKDEGKVAGDGPEEQRWIYNLQDCVYTRECGEVLQQWIDKMGLAQVNEWQQRLFWPVLKAMLRGVRILPQAKAKMAQEVQEALSDREAFLYNILGHTINVSSPKQMLTLFYEDLKQRPILKKQKVGPSRPTCNDEALVKIAAREPILKPVCNAIADIRTLRKFLNDFVLMPTDTDGRMRCSFNIAGDAGGKSAPYSYRLSSSENPFGSGGNLQTIPSEKSKSAGKSKQRGSMEFELPNIRSMYGPDPGFTFFDMDLDRADLQVVVWEADDADLKRALRMGVDIHLLNVYMIDGESEPPWEELVESHPKYPDHRGPRKHKREFMKVGVHGTNYIGSARTISEHTGRLVAEVERFQKRWFSIHPGIEKWHKRVDEQIRKQGFVENKFGYRWYIFDRMEGLLPKAVAWLPQSTVGNVINQAWLNIHERIPEVQVLLQVHDSLAGQWPSHRTAYVMPLMQAASRITIPYDDPLIIPTGIKTSTVSWGECK